MDAALGQYLEALFPHVWIVLGEFGGEEIDGFDACLGGDAGFGNVVVEVAGGGGGGGVGGAVQCRFVHGGLFYFCFELPSW